MDASDSHSKTTTVTGLGQPSRWTTKERNVWVPFLFMGSVLVYAARGALPVTVVEMSEEYNWDKRMSGVILSSFLWGYMLTQIIGGQLSDKHGGELILWVFGFGWPVAILSISVTASISNLLVIIANFTNGLCQGVYFPAIISIMSSRTNNEKRSLLYGLVASGCNLGSVMCGFLGYLFLFRDGWEYLVLTVGFLGLFWNLVLKWMCEAYEKKPLYKLIDGSTDSSSSRVGGGVVVGGGNINEAISVDIQKREATCVEIPWRLLLKQGPILAMFCTNFCQGMFFHSMMSWAPTYFHETFPNMQNKAWLYNITPWISRGLANILSGWLAKSMIEKGTSVTKTRKWMEGVANLGVTLPLLGLSVFGTSSSHFALSLTLFNLAFFLHGFEVAGSTINSTDLVPTYSGILYGMMNTGGSIAGIMGVSFTSHVLHTTHNWGIVFVVIASVTLSGFVVYTCFGSGRRLTHIDS